MAIVKLSLCLVKSPKIMPVLISLISVPQGTLRIVSSPEAPDFLLGPPLHQSSAIISSLNLKSNNV